MGIAHLTAFKSMIVDRKAGACVVKDKRIIATGYNGLPKFCEYHDNWNLLYLCHAIFNAVIHKASADDLRGCTLYTTHIPCNECTKVIIQSGIAKVIYVKRFEVDNQDLLKAAESMLVLAKNRNPDFDLNEFPMESMKNLGNIINLSSLGPQ